MTGHDYLSTSCWHAVHDDVAFPERRAVLHERCRQECKWCSERCRCDCHLAVTA